MTAELFATDDEITFAFDQQGRLRITMLPAYLPLAAWLHTDVQSNPAAVDMLVDLLRRAERDGLAVNGNGCAVSFAPDAVVIESLYDRWPPLRVPGDLFWAVLNGFRAFLADPRHDFRRPEDYPGVNRGVDLVQPDGRPPVLVDHTYFPADWAPEAVRAAAEGAWRGDDAYFDVRTGAWSGLWHGLELAGYFDPDTGSVLTYFPVLAP